MAIARFNYMHDSGYKTVPSHCDNAASIPVLLVFSNEIIKDTFQNELNTEKDEF